MSFRQLPPLTDKAARAATKTIGVGLVPGLTLRVYKTKKTFVLRITQNGVIKWLPIGTYGPMSIAEARRVAAAKLQEINNKGLLEVAPAPQRYDKYTVHDMLRDFIDSETERGRWDERGRQTHADKANGWIANHMSPEFLALPAIRLSPEIIKDEFGPLFLTMRSTPVKIVGEIRRAFTWAVAHKKVPFMANPADTKIIQSYLPSERKRPKRSHMPFLSPDRIPEFCAEVVRNKGAAARTLIFTILTCSRISNVLNLTWEQVDMNRKILTIKREDMKVKGLSFDRVTPLSEQAMAVLRGMPRFPTGPNEPDYIFRDFGFGRQPLSETSLRNLIRRINHDRNQRDLKPFHDPVEVDSWGRPRPPTPHGLARASFETWANSPGLYEHEVFDQNMVEACLDHFNPAYGGAYMREYPVEDMRRILALWGEYCFSMVK